MLKFLFILLAITAVWAAAAQAGVRENYWRTAMADASQTVSARKLKSANASVSASNLLAPSGFYKHGDQWTVAVSFMSYGMVYMTDGPQSKRNRVLAPVKYLFKVLSVDRKGAHIEVTPLKSGRISKIVFTIDRKLNLRDERSYYSDLPKPVVSVLARTGSVPMGFDSFPIEMPNLARAQALKSVSGRNKLKWFTSTDLFRRPVKMAWRPGDLWPKIVESTSGRSVLVSQVKK